MEVIIIIAESMETLLEAKACIKNKVIILPRINDSSNSLLKRRKLKEFFLRGEDVALASLYSNNSNICRTHIYKPDE